LWDFVGRYGESLALARVYPRRPAQLDWPETIFSETGDASRLQCQFAENQPPGDFHSQSYETNTT
jgi:hypothetical protein